MTTHGGVSPAAPPRLPLSPRTPRVPAAALPLLAGRGLQTQGLEQTLQKVANRHLAQGVGFQKEPGRARGRQTVHPCRGRGWLCATGV